LKKVKAASIAPFFLVRRKVNADIAEPRRAKDRIHDGVEQDIGVRMTIEPVRRRYLNTAENQSAPFGEAMHVIADPGASQVDACSR